MDPKIPKTTEPSFGISGSETSEAYTQAWERFRNFWIFWNVWKLGFSDLWNVRNLLNFWISGNVDIFHVRGRSLGRKGVGVSMCVYIHIYIYLFIYVYNNTVYIYTDIPKREQRQNIPMDETGQLIEVYSAPPHMCAYTYVYIHTQIHLQNYICRNTHL